jgi:hypothetical protein
MPRVIPDQRFDDLIRTATEIYRFYDEDGLASLAHDCGFDRVEFQRRRLRGIEIVFMWQWAVSWRLEVLR